jgi:hypothetical protein
MSETIEQLGLAIGDRVTVLVLAENPESGQDLELVGEVVAVDLVDFIALPNAQLLGEQRGVPPTLAIDWWAFSMAIGEEHEALTVYVPHADGLGERCWRVGVMSDAE